MNKFRRVSSYKINEKDERGRWTSEEVFYYNPTLETILQLLNEGPCRVVFNRVYYKKPGIRGMTCVIPPAFPQNAFLARHPDLIAVIDLDLQQWRSMKYGEIIILERLRQKDVSYAQRKLVASIRGKNWDYLWPGEEGDTLRPNNSDQSEKTFP
jgi:hypothetical protein